MRIEIADFDITEAAEAKFWSHGIDSDQVYAVLNRPLVVVRNRPDRAAPLSSSDVTITGTALQFR